MLGTRLQVSAQASEVSVAGPSMATMNRREAALGSYMIPAIPDEMDSDNDDAAEEQEEAPHCEHSPRLRCDRAVTVTAR